MRCSVLIGRFQNTRRFLSSSPAFEAIVWRQLMFRHSRLHCAVIDQVGSRCTLFCSTGQRLRVSNAPNDSFQGAHAS